MQIVSKNIFWLTFSRLAALILLLFAYAAQRKYLGPFAAGQFDFVLAYVLIFAIISDFGIQNFITKKMSEDKQNLQKYFLQFLFFEAVVVIALYASLLLIAHFRHFEPIIFRATVLVGLGMVVNALCFPFLAVMTATQDLRKVAFLNFLNSIINIVITVLAIYLNKGIVFLATIQVTFGLVDLVLYSFFVRKHLSLNFLGADKLLEILHFDTILKILKAGWPFILLVGFSAIYNRIDTVIIRRVLGFEQVGLYTTAYKYFDILAFFPATVSHVLYPHMAALAASSSWDEIKSTIEKYLRIMVVLALPLAVGGSILSKQLILLISDSRFVGGADALSILIWAIAILYIYIPVNALIISQLTKQAALVTGINVFINIVGNILLLPVYGIKGAAIMTVVSEGIQGIFYFTAVKKNVVNFKFVNLLLKPVIASLVMAICLWPLRDKSIFIVVPIGGIVYAFTLIIVKFFSKDDIALIKEVFRSA